MRVLGELGLRNWVYIWWFGLGLFVSFVIRWKWNKAVERNKEITRLVAMASEEAARAEHEAANEYTSTFVSVSVLQQSQCAICYCPTTTRCSRCKAVHYCSGKCQIIHWRLGHKDECYPPSNTSQFSGPKGDTNPEPVSEGDQDEVNENGVAVKGSFKPTETYNEEPSPPNFSSFKDDGKVGQAPVISDSFATSSMVRCFASVSELHVLSTPGAPEDPVFNDTARDSPETKAEVNSTITNSSPSEDSKLDVSVDSVSQDESTSSSGMSVAISNGPKVSKASISISDFWEGALNSNQFEYGVYNDSTRSSFTEGVEDDSADNKAPICLVLQDDPYSESHASKRDCHFPDDSDPNVLCNKFSCVAPRPEKIVTDMPMVKSSPSMRSEKPTSVESTSSKSQLLEGRDSGSISSSADDIKTYSSIRRQPVSNVMSSSVWKVVPKAKLYKLSKHNWNGFGCESSEKYNYKMLFPYEVFIKLYHWNKVELLPCGLTNCGNSCYINAVLQCLIFTRPLTAYLLECFHSKACPMKDWCFMCEFEGLIFKARKRKSPVSPIGIVSHLQSIGKHLGHGQQEDAHEFLRCVIDTMQYICMKEASEIAIDPLFEETTLIGLTFGGYLRSKITCMKCCGKSERRERMMDLSVEIHGHIGTLDEALKQFTTTEILDGENKYNCIRCRSYEKAKKNLRILEAPNVLTIALKRFQGGNFEKLNKSVKFTEFLNLAPYMSGTSDTSPIYRLYAVVVHRGSMSASFSGHYVCYVRSIQGKWFNIDDSTVKPVELKNVLSEEAYMLFYARCSPRGPSLIRNRAIYKNGKAKGRGRCSENVHTIFSESVTSKARHNPEVPNADPYTAQRKGEDYSYLTTLEGPSSGFTSFDSLNRKFHPIVRIPKVDSSTDSSSLLSCSDEGSCSTESTRDSASTDDLPEYIHCEAGHSWNNPLESHLLGVPETSGCSTQMVDGVLDMDGICSCQAHENGRERERWQEKGSHPILYSDTSIHCSKLNSSYSNSNCSGSPETNWERIGDVNSGVSQRRFTREKTAQVFY